MNPLIQLKKTRPLLITLALLCFGLLPQVQATPDPGSVDPFNTADGDHAFLATPPVLQMRHLVGMRSLPTQPATTTPLSALERWTSTTETIIRPLARRRFY
jgi:hypothetical protein